MRAAESPRLFAADFASPDPSAAVLLDARPMPPATGPDDELPPGDKLPSDDQAVVECKQLAVVEAPAWRLSADKQDAGRYHASSWPSKGVDGRHDDARSSLDDALPLRCHHHAGVRQVHAHNVVALGSARDAAASQARTGDAVAGDVALTPDARNDAVALHVDDTLGDVAHDAAQGGAHCSQTSDLRYRSDESSWAADDAEAGVDFAQDRKHRD